jgi:hypothetical protein
MAIRKVVDGYVQPFTRDSPLEFDRKEPIVAPGNRGSESWAILLVAGLLKDDNGPFAQKPAAHHGCAYRKLL